MRVPSPGFYRLYIGDKPRPTTGGAVTQLMTTDPVGEPFQIFAPVDGEDPQSISLSL